VFFVHANIFLHPTEHAELGFDADSFRMRAIDHAFRDRDIFLKRLVAGVDHDRAVKPGVDAVVARLFVTMIKVHRENGFGENSFRCANDRLEHAFVRVFACAFRKLNDKRRFALPIAAKQAQALFDVVNVIRANGELAVGNLVELSRRDDHAIREFSSLKI
jgi:hypothetical protein